MEWDKRWNLPVVLVVAAVATFLIWPMLSGNPDDHGPTCQLTGAAAGAAVTALSHNQGNAMQVMKVIAGYEVGRRCTEAIKSLDKGESSDVTFKFDTGNQVITRAWSTADFRSPPAPTYVSPLRKQKCDTTYLLGSFRQACYAGDLNPNWLS